MLRLTQSLLPLLTPPKHQPKLLQLKLLQPKLLQLPKDYHNLAQLFHQLPQHAKVVECAEQMLNALEPASHAVKTAAQEESLAMKSNTVHLHEHQNIN